MTAWLILPQGGSWRLCQDEDVLTFASLGMFGYGLYSAIWAVVDVIRGARIELWAEALIVVFGLLLALASAFVRVRLPGGLAVAIGAMLGLQALEVHTAAHLEAGLAPQIGRAVLAFFLVGSALAGEGQRPSGGRTGN
ncbi:MAG: hypothetical protein JSU08_12770 [Acidobacteria bacterium]|nr:hypothetical protein [Acidobacteriota bacterium]